MRDFLDQLDGQLQAVAAEQQAARTVPARRRRRPALLAGATASLAALGTVFALSGTSLADLPILATPTQDASRISGAAPAARKAGVDFSQAHAFDTTAGPGYVFLTPPRDVLCLTVPDPSEPGQYGGTCGAVERVERDGLELELAGDRGNDPAATSTVGFVLPEGARDVRLREAGGSTSRPTVQAGVLTAEIAAEATVLWEVAGQQRSKRFAGPFAASSGVIVTCPDGRDVIVAVQGTTPVTSSGARERRRRACG